MKVLYGRFIERYKAAGNLVALVFALVFGIFMISHAALYIVMFMVAREVITLPTWASLILNKLYSYFLIGLFGLGFLSLIYPVKYLLKRSKGAKRAFAIAVKTVSIAVATYVVSLFLTFPVLLFLDAGATEARRDSYEYFERYEDMGRDDLAAIMVPRAAVEIKRYYESGFGYQSCDISCKIGRAELTTYASKHGFAFKPADNTLFVPDDNAVIKELKIDYDNLDRYLFCSLEGEKRQILNWGDYGKIIYIYDVRDEKLFIRYFD